MFDTKEIYVCDKHKLTTSKELESNQYRVIEITRSYEQTRCNVKKCCQLAEWLIRAIISHKKIKAQAIINDFRKEQGIK